jgi:hypothetical protein
MQDNQTMVESKPRKRVLVPPGKPEPKNVEAFVTPKGGDIEIVFDKQFGLYVIKVGSGPLPSKLQGKFTEYARAKLAVDRYLKDYWKDR